LQLSRAHRRSRWRSSKARQPTSRWITGAQLDVAFVTGTRRRPIGDSVVLWEARVFALCLKGTRSPTANHLWESLRHEDFIVSRDAPGPEIHDYIVRRRRPRAKSVIERHGVGGDTADASGRLGFGISIAARRRRDRYPTLFPPTGHRGRLLPYSGSGCGQRQSGRCGVFLAWLVVGSGRRRRTRRSGFLTLRNLAKAPISGDESRQHGRDQLAGSLMDSRFRGDARRRRPRSRWTPRSSRQPDRLVVGDRSEFQLGHRAPPQPW